MTSLCDSLGGILYDDDLGDMMSLGDSLGDRISMHGGAGGWRVMSSSSDAWGVMSCLYDDWGVLSSLYGILCRLKIWSNLSSSTVLRSALFASELFFANVGVNAVRVNDIGGGSLCTSSLSGNTITSKLLFLRARTVITSSSSEELGLKGVVPGHSRCKKH